MILVLAGNHQQYLDWLRMTGHNRQDATYVHSFEQLCGWEKPTFVYTGEYWLNPAKFMFRQYEERVQREALFAGIRLLPGQEERVESGPVQFGDDWPGVFIRGDNAFGYRLSLEHAVSVLDKLIYAEKDEVKKLGIQVDVFALMNLKSLMMLIDSGNVNPSTKLPEEKQQS